MKIDIEIDSIKMLRETLCRAQSHFGIIHGTKYKGDIERLQQLINECDRHRPLGPDGKHGGRHTPTCGCSLDPRIARLMSGDWSFGCRGTHLGTGIDCPPGYNHHHDEFCKYPTETELFEAGIDPLKFRARDRG